MFSPRTEWLALYTGHAVLGAIYQHHLLLCARCMCSALGVRVVALIQLGDRSLFGFLSCCLDGSLCMSVCVSLALAGSGFALFGCKLGYLYNVFSIYFSIISIAWLCFSALPIYYDCMCLFRDPFAFCRLGLCSCGQVIITDTSHWIPHVQKLTPQTF